MAYDDEVGPGFMAAIAFGAIAVVIGIIWFVMFIGGWKSVPPDKLLLHYTGGPIQGTHFKQVVPPGTHTKFYGLLENYYYLPSTQRTYIISADPNRGDRKQVDTVSAASKDNVPMTFEGSVYFKLNTDPQVIRQFFEQICLHDHCTDLSSGGGWDSMLDQYFRPQIDQAVRTEAGKYNYVDMWHNPDVRTQIQNAIAPVLDNDINQAIGGNYFCGPDSTPKNCTNFGFVLAAVNPPQAVQDQFTATAASQQAVQKAQQDAAAKVAAAKGDADSQAIRAAAPSVPPQATNYIKAQAEAACASNPSCKLVIIDGNASNVQVSGQ